MIRQFPGIKDVTVQAFEYDNGGKYIAAYIVSDEPVDIKELNAFIGQQKPPYMIPAATMQIDAIPLNQNQKVNRKALPAPVIQAADHEYVEPVNEVEKLFCKIYSDILSMDKIGATDNFFELGGTSLMVTRVIIEADKAGKPTATCLPTRLHANCPTSFQATRTTMTKKPATSTTVPSTPFLKATRSTLSKAENGNPSAMYC